MKRTNLLIGAWLNIVGACVSLFVSIVCLCVFATGTATVAEVAMTIFLVVLALMFLIVSFISRSIWNASPNKFKKQVIFVYFELLIAVAHNIVAGVLWCYVYYLDYLITIPIALLFSLLLIPIVVDLCLENKRASAYLEKNPHANEEELMQEEKKTKQQYISKKQEEFVVEKGKVEMEKVKKVQKTNNPKLSDMEVLELKLKKLMYMKEAEIITQEEFVELKKKIIKEML